MNRSSYYIAAENARQTIESRRQLLPIIEAWWLENGWYPTLPPFLDLAVLARQVAAFRYEDCVFHTLASQARLLPMCLELTCDKFSSHSSYKKSLLQPKIFGGFGRNGGMSTKRHKLAPIAPWNAKRLDQVVLDSGTSLLDFHHRRYDAAFGRIYRADNADWVDGKFAGAKEYYPVFLSLFLAHAVLFEDYHGGESGGKLDTLTTEIFEPTFEALTAQFGVSPMIVSMPWAPELALHPPALNWRDHGVIPAHMLELPITVT